MTSDCLYGDRDGDYCAQIVSRDCYAEQVRRTCCATCQRYRYYLSGQLTVLAPINPLEFRGNYSATLNNMKLVHWSLMGGLLHLVQRRRRSPPRPLLTVPNITAHPSTASVPITVLLYNGPLLCGFNSTQLNSSLFEKHNRKIIRIKNNRLPERCEAICAGHLRL